MKILLTNHQLLNLRGTEIFTYTIAKFLKKNGHQVFVYSRYIDKMLPLFEKISVPVTNNLDKIKNSKFDIAHVHHNINAVEIRHAFHSLPIIFLSHGVRPFLEQPPIFNLKISKFLAVSEDVEKNLINKGCSKNRTSIFRNLVDSQLFISKKQINYKPKKALVISSTIDEEKEKNITFACKRLKISVKFVGGKFGSVDNRTLPNLINKADIVFTLGRGAIEAMMCERIPIVYDWLGGDGLVTPKNITEIMKVNFSGRLLRKKFNTDQLIQEIKKYKQAYGKSLRKICLKYFDADNNIKELLRTYQDASIDFKINTEKVDWQMVDFYSLSISESFRRMNTQTIRLLNKEKSKIKNSVYIDKPLIYIFLLKFKNILKKIISNPKYFSIRNLLKLIFFLPINLISNKSLHEYISNQDLQYDPRDYLSKIKLSQSFRLVKKYWNLKDLLNHIIKKPNSINRLKQLWKYIQSREKFYDQNEYIDKILTSRTFKIFRYSWAIKSIIKTSIYTTNYSIYDFDKKFTEILNRKVDINDFYKLKISRGGHSSLQSLSSLIFNADQLFKLGQLNKSIKLWKQILLLYPNSEMVTGHARLNISVIHRIKNLQQYQNQVYKYNNQKSKQHTKKPKIVIYTAIVNSYDSIKLPEKLDKRIDYVLFTDKPAFDVGVYKIRPISYFNEDVIKTARYIKTHPHLLLNEYDIAIWIDSNITIIGDIYPLINKFINSKNPVGAVRHPIRNNIYEEIEECILRNKDHNSTLQKQVSNYKKLDFYHSDLIESNFMMFKVKNRQVHKFLNTWWEEIDKFSRRDQLSLNYSLLKNRINWHRILDRPESIRNHHLFAFTPHDLNQGPMNILIKKLRGKYVNPYSELSNKVNFYQSELIKYKHNVEIVICVHNALDDVKLCLNSIKKHRVSSLSRLIIINDGSDKLTTNYLN